MKQQKKMPMAVRCCFIYLCSHFFKIQIILLIKRKYTYFTVYVNGAFNKQYFLRNVLNNSFISANVFAKCGESVFSSRIFSFLIKNRNKFVTFEGLKETVAWEFLPLVFSSINCPGLPDKAPTCVRIWFLIHWVLTLRNASYSRVMTTRYVAQSQHIFVNISAKSNQNLENSLEL
jgi:hypothetical protein